MEDILESPHIPATTLLVLKYCRYHLEATTLAEITTSNGRRILPTAFYSEKIAQKQQMPHRVEE
eukprot:11081860-Ditylum_brightwellii.AAC.1